MSLKNKLPAQFDVVGQQRHRASISVLPCPKPPARVILMFSTHPTATYEHSNSILRDMLENVN